VRDCGKLIQFLKERGIIQWALLCFNEVQIRCKVVFCNPAPWSNQCDQFPCHSRPQRPRSFWSALKIKTSGQVQRHSGFHGFVNTIDWDQNQSDLSDLTQSMRRVTGTVRESRTSGVGPGQRSWFSVLTKRIAASGDENVSLPEFSSNHKSKMAVDGNVWCVCRVRTLLVNLVPESVSFRSEVTERHTLYSGLILRMRLRSTILGANQKHPGLRKVDGCLGAKFSGLMC